MEAQILRPARVTKDAKVLVLASRFNDLIVSRLVEGAVEAFREAEIPADRIDVLWVPGAFELPLAAQAAARSRKYVAIAAVGCVIRGQTAHFDYVAGECASGLSRVALQEHLPVSFGVLTVDTLEQAFDRAGGKTGNKGHECARVALDMAAALRHFGS